MKGRLLYIVGTNAFLMEAGDSLFFHAEIPHRWQNQGDEPVEALFILCRDELPSPADNTEQDTNCPHFDA